MGYLILFGAAALMIAIAIILGKYLRRRDQQAPGTYIDFQGRERKL